MFCCHFRRRTTVKYTVLYSCACRYNTTVCRQLWMLRPLSNRLIDLLIIRSINPCIDWSIFIAGVHVCLVMAKFIIRKVQAIIGDGMFGRTSQTARSSQIVRRRLPVRNVINNDRSRYYIALCSATSIINTHLAGAPCVHWQPNLLESSPASQPGQQSRHSGYRENVIIRTRQAPDARET